MMKSTGPGRVVLNSLLSGAAIHIKNGASCNVCACGEIGKVDMLLPRRRGNGLLRRRLFAISSPYIFVTTPCQHLPRVKSSQPFTSAYYIKTTMLVPTTYFNFYADCAPR